MKLKLKSADLKLWLGRVTKNVKGGRSAVPVLDTVRMEADEESHLTLDFTNLDIWQRVTVPAEVTRGGSALVNADKLLKAVSMMEEAEVSLELVPQGLLLKGSSASYTFAVLAVDEFPSEPSLVAESGVLKVEVAGRFLEGMITAVEGAMSVDASCYLLNSICLEVDGSVVRMVATDGRRLSLYERDLTTLAPDVLSEGSDGPILIPASSVSAIKRLCAAAGADSVRLFADHRAVSIWYGNWWLRSKVTEGKFPNYRQVIPDITTIERPVQILPDEWLSAVETVLAIALTGSDKQPKLKISGSKFSLEEPEIGSALVQVSDTDAAEVVVNAQFMASALKAIPTGKAIFHPLPAGQPLVLTLPTYDNPKAELKWTHVLMPIRTAGN